MSTSYYLVCHTHKEFIELVTQHAGSTTLGPVYGLSGFAMTHSTRDCRARIAHEGSVDRCMDVLGKNAAWIWDDVERTAEVYRELAHPLDANEEP